MLASLRTVHKAVDTSPSSGAVQFSVQVAFTSDTGIAGLALACFSLQSYECWGQTELVQVCQWLK